MLWSNHSGVLTNNQLSKTFRRVAQPLFKFRQFCDTKFAFGKGSGESITWLQVANLGNYGGKLTETNTFFETTQPLYRCTSTVNEYGLSIPWTFKSEALSEFDVEEIMRSGLVDDMAKVLEGLAEREFSDTPLKVTATTTASLNVCTGTATASNTGGINSLHVRKCILELKKRNIPGFTKLGGGYVGILSAGATDCLRGEITDGSTGGMASTGFLGSETGSKIFINGEIGSLHGVRLVEDTFGTMFAYDPTTRTATSKKSLTTSRTLKTLTQATYWQTGAECLESYFFGSPTVAQVISVPEEIRRKIPTDYGRSKGIAWYAILDFKLMWDYAACITNSLANESIVHFTAR